MEPCRKGRRMNMEMILAILSRYGWSSFSLKIILGMRHILCNSHDLCRAGNAWRRDGAES